MTLGQIELVFTFIASTMFFHERSTRTEIIGIVLIATVLAGGRGVFGQAEHMLRSRAKDA